VLSSDVKLSKNGGTFANKADATAPSHNANGFYKVTLNSVDLNTAGWLDVSIKVAGALSVWARIQVVTQATWDALHTDGLHNFDPAIDTVTTVTTVTDLGATAQSRVKTKCEEALQTFNLDNVIQKSATVGTGSTTTTLTSDLSETTLNYWKGSLLVMTSGALKGQARRVTAYLNGGNISVSPVLTGSAPVSGDTFVLMSFTDQMVADSLGATSQVVIDAIVDQSLVDYDAVVPADLPANFADLAITPTNGEVTVGTNNDKTGYSISGTKTTLDVLKDFDPTTQEVDIGKVKGTPVTGVNDFKADVTNLDATVSSRATPADVASELDTRVSTDTLNELGTAPPKNPSIEQAIMWLYMMTRNVLKSTSTQMKVHNDAGTVVATQNLSDDGTTFTKNKAV